MARVGAATIKGVPALGAPQNDGLSRAHPQADFLGYAEVIDAGKYCKTVRSQNGLKSLYGSWN